MKTLEEWKKALFSGKISYQPVLASKKFACNFWELCYDCVQRRATIHEKYIEVPE